MYLFTLFCSAVVLTVPFVLIQEVYTSLYRDCPDKATKKQMAFILARQMLPIQIEEEDEDLNEILLNSHLNQNFLSLARDLDIMEAKVCCLHIRVRLSYCRQLFFLIFYILIRGKLYVAFFYAFRFLKTSTSHTLSLVAHHLAETSILPDRTCQRLLSTDL